MTKITRNLLMKPFINNLLVLGIGAMIAGGCSSKESEPASTSQLPVIEVIEQPVIPTEPAPAPKPVPESKAAPVPPVKTVSAPTLTEQETVSRFNQWDQKLLSLKTSFVQTTEYDGVQVSQSKGILFYNKEHQLLRLDTLGEDGNVEQSAITNKKDILILDESGKHVTTLSWQEWQQGQANQALFDFGNYTALIERHHVKRTQPHQLVLTPKEGDPYTLYVTLSEKDFFPTELKIESDLLVTRAQLQQTQKNQPLDLTLFGGFVK